MALLFQLIYGIWITAFYKKVLGCSNSLRPDRVRDPLKNGHHSNCLCLQLLAISQLQLTPRDESLWKQKVREWLSLGSLQSYLLLPLGLDLWIWTLKLVDSLINVLQLDLLASVIFELRPMQTPSVVSLAGCLVSFPFHSLRSLSALGRAEIERKANNCQFRVVR